MSEKKKNALRKVFRLIHLYLGLFTGVVVFIVAITGCCWVFREEIKSLTDPEIVIRSKKPSQISPTQVKTIANLELPNRHIHGVVYESSDYQPMEVIFYEADPLFYYSLFLDPYTGEVLKRVDHTKGFFAFVLDGHLNLWLPPSIGEYVVSYSTLIFLFSIITGIVLWWPKKKKNIKQRFMFDWKSTTRWKRKNFDLHTVVGFYTSIFALLFAITGLVMALNWFYFLYYIAIGGTSEMRFIIPENVSNIHERVENDTRPLDRLPSYLKSKYPKAKDFEIHYPNADSMSIYVEVSNSDGIFYNSDFRFYDQNTMQEIDSPSIYGLYENADTQDQIMRMNYDIHIGAILGLPGKILAFLASLAVAFLSVTGVLLWIGRKKKDKNKKSQTRKAVHEMGLDDSTC